MTTPTEEKKKLNPKQELFCQYYASDREFFGNGVESYAAAYDIDLTDPKKYKAAQSSASVFLSNHIILERINEIFEGRGLNDAFVDKQLEFVITQHADFNSKISAIREYNKLKKRITDKLDLTSGGKSFNFLDVLQHATTDERAATAEDTTAGPGGTDSLSEAS